MLVRKMGTISILPKCKSEVENKLSTAKMPLRNWDWSRLSTIKLHS